MSGRTMSGRTAHARAWLGIPRRVWLYALLFAAITSLPYVFGYLAAPEGGAFTGNALAQARVDYNSQLARAWSGYEGSWLHVDRFTPEDHPPILMQPLYSAFGHISRLTGLPLDATYNLGRFVLALVMVLVIWLFAARFLEGDRARWTALLLATMAGDLGWVLYFVAPAQAAAVAPIEFWLFDAHTFMVALAFPHFAGAVITLLAFLLGFDRWLARPSWRGIGWLVLWSLLAGQFMPYAMLLTALIVAVLSLGALARGRLTVRQVLMLIPVALAHAAVVIYYAVALASDPVWQGFTAQNLTLSPAPVYYLLGYAWLLVPGVLGLWQLWRTRDGRWLVPLAWVLIVGPLLYAPLPTQRRFLMGVQVPLALLAAVGVERARAWWIGRGRTLARWRLLMAVLLLLSALSPVLVMARVLGQLNPAASPDLFLSADEISALAWLRDQPPETVVLATFESGGQAVAFSGRRVYLGHWIETPDFPARQTNVIAFFKTEGIHLEDDARLALLVDYRIGYVWYDDNARAIGDWSPDGVPWLDVAFSAGSVTVYEVVP
ncbi:MAG: hypothetical protein JW910_14970 [Anaerolineae bacterium]|nr:hypothetical protein [Anaerolineae bacterium]